MRLLVGTAPERTAPPPSGGRCPRADGTAPERRTMSRAADDVERAARGLPALELGLGLRGDGVLQRLLSGRLGERRRRHLLSSHRA